MIRGYVTVLSASEAERRALFDAAAQRLGTAARNVEKDFWVTWTLDALFNGLGPDRPRLLFKGGTSLSKGFGLISRFSEDIDITVFRADLGQPASVEELEALTGRKRRARLDAIKQACQAYIATDLHSGLSSLLQQTMAESGLAKDDARVVMDTNDADQQSLLLWYPSVTADSAGGYVQPAVKVESGAKSALDPHHSLTMTPYIAGDVADIDLAVPNVTTVDPERTFWDKVIILHGLRRWFERRGVLRAGGQRVSRHYYDMHQLLHSDAGIRALADKALAVDCSRHARMFFNSTDLDLLTALPGTFALLPTPPMLDELQRDYGAMAGMIFGDTPSFSSIIDSIATIEERANAQ